MADEGRSRATAVTFEELVERLRTSGPSRLDPWQFFRRLEAASPDRPRLGESRLPAEDALRLAQEPSPAFEPSALAGVEQTKTGLIRILVTFFGLFGPHGPLPIHLTEYARDRLRHRNDPTFSRFADVFHHRLISLLYRAHANADPAIESDRKDRDRFRIYVGALIGMATAGLGQRRAVPDDLFLHFAGRVAPHARNASGLAVVLEGYFGVPVRIEEFVGEWVNVPDDEQWRLGATGPRAMLGRASLGRRVWLPQGKFRVVVGPMDHQSFGSLLPGSDALKRLQSIVRSYVGEGLEWDLALLPDATGQRPLQLGAGWLGWTSWLGSPAGSSPAVIVRPPPLEAPGDDDRDLDPPRGPVPTEM